ncbi:MAG TPA: hypothetical protein PKH77_05205 [Anaerolineae bacterium]|nr:hypothetical protein [Anaerolineae bacterium]
MPETRRLSYQDAELDVTLELGAATTLAGVKRAMFQGRALAYLDEGIPPAGEARAVSSLEVAARRIVVQYLYPDLLAAVVAAEGLDPEMSVADFLALPEALTDPWQNLVYDLNPHWYPFQRPEDKPDQESSEKKGVTPSSDSANAS